MSLASATQLLGKRIFSGIQPTGIPHLGNYFGAIQQWIKLTEDYDKLGQQSEPKPIFCIVDIHAYSGQHVRFGEPFYQNIVSTLASMLAVGLDTNKCIIYRQSDVLEHNYLSNILHNFVSIQRLSSMIQFKEKSRQRISNRSSSIATGLLTYPVLQAADILLYKADLVPVGQDQAQHIELTRDIANKFNRSIRKQFFPLPVAKLQDFEACQRIMSLRDSTKKMSKSDPDLRSFIEIVDEPDVIVDKCKKALSDSLERVTYDPETRPAISNLMLLYHLISGESMEQITNKFEAKQTGQFKLELADLLIEEFRPARSEFRRLIKDRVHLEWILSDGALEAREWASKTISLIKYELGSNMSDI